MCVRNLKNRRGSLSSCVGVGGFWLRSKGKSRAPENITLQSLNHVFIRHNGCDSLLPEGG